MAKLKVYSVQTFGRGFPEDDFQQVRACVAATSQKEAARLTGFDSLYQFKQCCGGETWNEKEVRLAMREPGTVYAQSMSWGGVPHFKCVLEHNTLRVAKGAKGE